jgi:hypothetical protein
LPLKTISFIFFVSFVSTLYANCSEVDNVNIGVKSKLSICLDDSSNAIITIMMQILAPTKGSSLYDFPVNDSLIGLRGENLSENLMNINIATTLNETDYVIITKKTENEEYSITDFYGGIIGKKANLTINEISKIRFDNIKINANESFQFVILGGGLIGSGTQLKITSMSNVIFSNNIVKIFGTSRTLNGGGLIGSNVGSDAFITSITSAIFYNNNISVTTGSISGGGLIGGRMANTDIKKFTTSLDNTNFSSNNVTANLISGGGLIGVHVGNLEINTIANSIFYNNIIAITTKINGGGLFGVSKEATTSGGVFTIHNITNSIFSNNVIGTDATTLINGGLFYIGKITNDVTITNSSFINNTFKTSDSYGGTFTIDTPTAIVLNLEENTEFSNNKIIKSGVEYFNSISFVGAGNATINIINNVKLYDGIYSKANAFVLNTDGETDFYWGGVNNIMNGTINFNIGSNVYLQNGFKYCKNIDIFNTGCINSNIGSIDNIKGALIFDELNTNVTTNLTFDGGSLNFVLLENMNSGDTILTLFGTIDLTSTTINIDYDNLVLENYNVNDFFNLIIATNINGWEEQDVILKEVNGVNYTMILVRDGGGLVFKILGIENIVEPPVEEDPIEEEEPPEGEGEDSSGEGDGTTIPPVVPPITDDPMEDDPPEEEGGDSSGEGDGTTTPPDDGTTEEPDEPPVDEGTTEEPDDGPLPVVDSGDESIEPESVVLTPEQELQIQKQRQQEAMHVFKEETKNIAEASLTNTIVINNSADLIANIDYKQISVNTINASQFANFSNISMGTGKYKTGSYIKMNSYNFILGLGTRFNYDFDKSIKEYVIGFFVEGGYGKFKSHLNNGDTGDGITKSFGIGIANNVEFKNNIWTEFSLRFGKSLTDYEGDKIYIIDVNNNLVLNKYNSNSIYVGGLIGVGYKFENNYSIYGKYFLTQTTSENLTLPTGQKIEFDKVFSNRVRVGGKYTIEIENKDKDKKQKDKYYIGLYYEYDFAGDMRVKIDGDAVATPSIKGGTAVIEGGFEYNYNDNLSFGIKGDGYSGIREGVSGGVIIKYVFNVDKVKDAMKEKWGELRGGK